MQFLSCQILHKSCIQAFFDIAEAKALSQTAHQLNSWNHSTDKINKSEEKKIFFAVFIWHIK